MIFSLITRIGMHGANIGLWIPILVIKLKIILFVDISACNMKEGSIGEVAQALELGTNGCKN